MLDEIEPRIPGRFLRRGPLLCGQVSRVTTSSLLPHVFFPATGRIEIASSSTRAQAAVKAMTRLHGSFSYERRPR
jgi:hypothetical protein